MPESRYLVTSGSTLGVLRNDGTAAILDPTASNAPITAAFASSALATDRRWLSAAEPDLAIGSIDSGVQAIAITLDGTDTPDIALSTGGILDDTLSGVIGIVDRADPTFPPFVHRDGVPHPAPRSDFLAFYSSVAGGVFMLGGKDATGTTMHDLWFRPIADDWRQVPAFPYALGTALAATFAYGDQRFYVLDRISVGESPKSHTTVDAARLVRIDFRNGATELLGIWKLGKQFSAYYLTVDRDGGILLTAVDGVFSRIAKLGADAHGAYAQAVAMVEPAVIVAPIVDKSGYSLLWRSGNAIVTKHLTKLFNPSKARVPLLTFFQ